MWAYALRRMLWMIPTFLGILVINFGVLRLQGNSLSDQLASGSGGGGKGAEAGERKVEAATQSVETWLGRFRRTGNDRPALLNTRGFTSTETVLERLRATERGPKVDEAKRQRVEIEDLWFQGHFLVEPLAAILADDAQAKFHGPASMALSLCAIRPLLPEDLVSMPSAEQSRLRARNEDLKRNRIAYENRSEGGYVTTDAQAAAKRAAMLAIIRRDVADFSRDGRWGALLGETGFTDFMWRLATGNLYSETRKADVFAIIGQRWSVTAWLNLLAIAIGWLVSIPLGVWSARNANTLADRSVTGALFALWSVPSFFVATLMLHHFCTASGSEGAWFPNRGLSSPDSLWYSTPRYLLDLLWHAFLPLVCLTYGSFTSLSRYMRANVLEQLNSDYVRTARAKGVDEDTVVWSHATRNSMVTMITLGAGLLASLFGGFVFIEYVFSIPGLGTLMLEAAKQQDAPLLMGTTVISVLLLLVGILIADLLYAVADPRIKARYG
jgi:peptide/nickel transport system permease protein